MNNKIYKYKEENIIKDKNVLVVYQPSRHGTILKIKDIVKEEFLNKNYGVSIHTLSKENEIYSNYECVVFIIPVYFSNINQEFINKLKNGKIKRLIVIYNGLNETSNKEDDVIKKIVGKNYKKIKTHTKDIEIVKEFINEVIK